MKKLWRLFPDFSRAWKSYVNPYLPLGIEKKKEMSKLDLEEKLLSKQHLEAFLSIQTFGKCWGIVKSHLILYEKYEELKESLDLIFDKIRQLEKWNNP